MVNSKTILFVTSCPLPWGGSEELWSGTAEQLVKRGHHILSGWTENIPSRSYHPNWIQLRRSGVKINRFGVHPIERAIVDATLRYKPRHYRLASFVSNRFLAARLRSRKPDLVVVSQGRAYDGCVPIPMPEICDLAGIPYVLICQKAAENHWPQDESLSALRRAYRFATHSYFVSKHNLLMVQSQLGMDLTASSVIRNPFLVPHDRALPWPEPSTSPWRLACVGRLWPEEKGQDVILKVLAMPKWRNRPLYVSFYGEGAMEQALKGMARYFGLQQVSFPGFASPMDIWRDNHGLVLPCRAEGLPLVQVEAMLCGRVVIVADAGGTSEIITDGVQGFLAGSASITEMDAALERAWQRRDQWPQIGHAAAEHIRTLYPPDPCSVFADHLELILDQLPVPSSK